jgi:hypothetical protein
LLKFDKDASERGSLTIETAIIFSTIFFMLIALIYITLLMYQQSYIQSLASKAAQRGAAVYSNSNKDMYIGGIYTKDIQDRDPYSSLFNLDSEIKNERVGSYIKSQINVFSLLKSKQPQISVESYNFVLYQKIIVIVAEEYELPVGNLLKTFGLSSTFPLTARAEAIVNNPAEFIRNTDFITETASEFLVKTEADSKKSGSDVKSTISNILSKITGFWKKK